MSSKFHGNKTLPTKKLDRVHGLANSYVRDRIDSILDTVEADLKGDDDVVVWDRQRAKLAIGRQLALSYAIGAMDKSENKNLILL